MLKFLTMIVSYSVSLKFYQLLPNEVYGSVARCLHVKNCYDFSENLAYYHYIMYFFPPDNLSFMSSLQLLELFHFLLISVSIGSW